jgi:hypothetical protein
MVPVASSASLSAKAVSFPTVLKVDEVEAPQEAEIVSAESSSEEEAATLKAPTVVTVTPVIASDSPTKRGRRTSKMTRFTELETINSNTTVSIETRRPAPQEEEEKRRPTANVTALPTNFDESALPAPKEIVLPASPPAQSKPGKLSKSAAPGGKLVKKNRWSLRSGKSTAVAV